MQKAKVTDLVAETLKDFLPGLELELFMSEFVKEGKEWYLRVYIEKSEGAAEKYVNINECEAVSQFLSEKFDELDPIEQNYYLEVSSPGLDRPLIREHDFIRFKGEVIDVKLYKGFEGKKQYEGVLLEKTEEVLAIEVPEGKSVKRIEIPNELVSKVKLAVIF